MTLARLPRNSEGLTRYRHSNGYSIRQERRDWNHVPVPGGYVGSNDPKTWWEVRPWATQSVGGDWPRTFQTLRATRQWCDEHPRGSA